MADSELTKPQEVVSTETPAKVLYEQAMDATDEQHALSIWQGLHLYPKAIGWAAYFSLGIIMVAFDPQLIGQLIATPKFQKDFGNAYEDGYIIAAPWQTGLNMGAPIGQVFGAFFAGIFMERIGLKKSFAACNLLIIGCVFIQFFARSLAVLLVGEILAGLVLGCFVVIAPAYASEVAPLALRGPITASINLCFATGQLIANGTVDGTQKLSTHWAYSIPFSIQWLWPLIIIVGYPFAPESPWWLQRHGHLEEAESALARLSSSSVDVKAALAVIIETDRVEREMQIGSSYLDCFRGTNLRRTNISIAVMSIQVFSGIYLASYATFFFEVAGLPTNEAFNLGVGFIALGFLATVLSWFVLSYAGRRTLYNVGLATLTVIQFVIGGLDCAPNYSNRPGIAWAESVLMLVWYFVYSLSIGPIAYVILCEVCAVRVRAKTIAISLAVEALATILMTVIFPYMINPDEANMRGKVGFFFGGLALLCLAWSWTSLPELRGRTYYEADVLFNQNIKTKDFPKTIVTAMKDVKGNQPIAIAVIKEGDV